MNAYHVLPFDCMNTTIVGVHPGNWKQTCGADCSVVVDRRHDEYRPGRVILWRSDMHGCVVAVPDATTAYGEHTIL